MKKQEIYILSHKKIDYDVELNKYIPLQVGASLSKEDLFQVKDNTGINISDKNPYYLETTGIYWIWKNSDADIKGQMQVRRFLSINPDFVQTILNDYDIILANPIVLNFTIANHYMVYHDIDDLNLVKEVIKENYPDYLHSFINFIEEGNILFYSNSFITRKEIYDAASEFVFSILDMVEDSLQLYDEEKRRQHAEVVVTKYSTLKTKEFEHTDIDQVKYQERVCAYLSERLFTLYFLHNKLKIYKCGNYIKMEDNMSI